MARKPIRQKIEFEGDEKLKKDLEALGKTGEKAFKQIQTAVNRVNFKSLTGQVKLLGSELLTFGRRASLALAGLGLVGGLSFAGTTRELFQLAKAAGEVADQTGKAAQKAGIATEQFSALAFAAEQSDVEQGALVTSLNLFNKQLAKAAQGNKDSVALFKSLGVSITDANGRLRPTHDILLDIAEAFKRMPEGVKQSTTSLKLFGRGGAAMIPFLNEGREGILALEEQARSLGITLTEEQAKIGDSLGDALDRTSAAVRGIRLQLGLVFAPALTRVADVFTQRIVASRRAILEFGNSIADRVVPIVEDLINALSGNDAAVKNSGIIQLRDQVIELGSATSTAVNSIIIPAFNGLMAVLDTIADVINSVFGTDLSGKAIAIAAAVASLTGGFRLLAAAIRVAFVALVLFGKHPVVAILIALAIRLNGLIDRFNASKNAALQNNTALNELQTALERVKNNVPGAREEFNLLAESHREAAQAAVDSAKKELEAAKTLLAIEKDRAAAKVDPELPGGEQNELAKQTLANTLARIEEREEQLNRASVNLARAVRRQEEISDTIAGKTSDKIDDQRKKIDGVAASVANVGDNASKSKSQVKELGDEVARTIKVTSFGGGTKTEQLFDVDASGAARARKAVDDLTQAVSQTDDEAGAAADALDRVDDQAEAVGTATETAAPKVDKLNKALKESSTTVINVAEALGKAVTDASAISSTADTVATKMTEAKGAADELFVTASNNSEGLNTALETTTDSAAGLGTALNDASTAADNLGTSVAGIEDVAAGVANALLSPFQNVASGITSIMSQTSNVVRTGFSSLQSLIASATASINSSINQIISRLRQAAAEAARLRASANSSSRTTNQGSRSGFASGGLFRGAGTGTSDSNVIRISSGEFIVREAATRRFLPLLRMINSLRLPKDFWDKLPQFRIGGLVGQTLTTGVKLPRYASGGLTTRAPAGNGFTQPVHLHFERPGGGETTVLVMAEPTAPSQMLEFARSSARNSTGRPQSWKGRIG